MHIPLRVHVPEADPSVVLRKYACAALEDTPHIRPESGDRMQMIVWLRT